MVVTFQGYAHFSKCYKTVNRFPWRPAFSADKIRLQIVAYLPKIDNIFSEFFM